MKNDRARSLMSIVAGMLPGLGGTSPLIEANYSSIPNNRNSKTGALKIQRESRRKRNIALRNRNR